MVVSDDDAHRVASTQGCVDGIRHVKKVGIGGIGDKRPCSSYRPIVLDAACARPQG
jgi:hypothetical protein